MPDQLKLLVKKLHPDAKIPHKSRDSDEGYDLFANEDMVIPSGETRKVNTDIACVATTVRTSYDVRGNKCGEEYLWDYWIQIEGRSSLGKIGITPLGGICDSKYIGPLGVLLSNISKQPYTVKKGDKIAQLVPRKHYHFPVEEVDELPETDRGDKGFGSSGR